MAAVAAVAEAPPFFAAANIYNVIGIISSMIGLVGFIESNVPKGPRPGDSSVRIAIGLWGNELNLGSLFHAEGEAPHVGAFNEDRQYIGRSETDHQIGPGSFLDITISQTGTGGQQATYLQIIPRDDDELCVAYIAQTWADGTVRGWLGDMGKGCDRDWYFSDVIVGEAHKPTCTWIASNHNYAIATAALQMHMQSFTNLTSNYTKEVDHYCQWPVMHFQAELPKHPSGYPDHLPLFFDGSKPSAKDGDIQCDGLDDYIGGPDWPGHGARRKSPRLARRSGSAVFGHLVASEHDHHSALELCASKSSHGPDFFSHSEGIFCDMDTKTAWPLCGEQGLSSSPPSTEEKEKGCYHWDTHSLVLPGEEAGTARNYSHVVEWA